MIPLYYTQPTTVLDCLDAILFNAIGRSLFTRDHLFFLFILILYLLLILN